MILSLLLACADPPPAPVGELIFLRGAVLSPAGEEGRALSDGRRLVLQDWSPGQTLTVNGLSGAAPARAECVPLFSVELGDVARLAAAGGSPDTAVAFSPDGAWLAIGTFQGEVRVVDAWTGALKGKKHLAETMAKAVAWSDDGATLFAAEQSPDAFVYALDPDTLEPRWTRRLADEVQSSAPPAGEDLYGVYTLPAAYGLEPLPDGGVLVAANHGWTGPDGQRLNQARLLRLGPDGQTLAAWPAEGPADATLLNPAVDRAGGLVVMPVSRTADGPPPPDLPLYGVAVLRLEDLSLVTSKTEQPLAPWFTEARIWEAADVSAAQDALLMGFNDGRVRVYHLDGRPRLAVDSGVPVLAGDVPISATVGHGLIWGDEVIFSTSNTNIPWGAAAPDLRPPTAHPGENTIFAFDLDGAPRWSWRGEQRLQGLTLGPDRRTLLAGAGQRVSDDRRDLFGALLFDLGDPAAPDDRSGEQRLSALCPTESPVYFRAALSADGRVAVVEQPFQTPDGAVAGAYRVTVAR